MQSKHNFKRENEVIFSIITDAKKWLYLAVKSLSALHREVTAKNKGDSYYLNCFHSYSTQNKLEKHEKVCNDHDYYYVDLPEQDNKRSKYNHGEMSLKAPFMLT